MAPEVCGALSGVRWSSHLVTHFAGLGVHPSQQQILDTMENAFPDCVAFFLPGTSTPL